MKTTVTLESIARDEDPFRAYLRKLNITFTFWDEEVSGTVMVPVAQETVRDVDIVAITREHLRGVFLRLADEVTRPQEIKQPVDAQEADSVEGKIDRDPSEIASEIRSEQIAAAKLLIAVKYYAKGAVPGAEMLPTAREDSEGITDIERFAPGVSTVVHKTAPDGFGGANTFLNLHVGAWLKTNYSHEPYYRRNVLGDIKQAVGLIGKDGANPRACRQLWNELLSHAH